MFGWLFETSPCVCDGAPPPAHTLTTFTRVLARAHGVTPVLTNLCVPANTRTGRSRTPDSSFTVLAHSRSHALTHAVHAQLGSHRLSHTLAWAHTCTLTQFTPALTPVSTRVHICTQVTPAPTCSQVLTVCVHTHAHARLLSHVTHTCTLGKLAALPAARHTGGYEHPTKTSWQLCPFVSVHEASPMRHHSCCRSSLGGPGGGRQSPNVKGGDGRGPVDTQTSPRPPGSGVRVGAVSARPALAPGSSGHTPSHTGPCLVTASPWFRM